MKKYLFTVLGILFVLLAGPVSAADFSLSFDTTYSFDESGMAMVNKKFILTNLTTANYPSEYYLELPNDASNVIAFDKEGQTNSLVIDENGQKRVQLTFNQQPLGFGKELTIVLSYNTSTLAKNENNRWRIAIPGHAGGEDVADYIVSVELPPAWGEPQRVIPPPDIPYHWTLSERPESLISIDFEQVKIPSPTTTPTSSAFPIAVGVSVGVIIVFVLFEFLRRT
jgi:hypothetical protein